MGLLRYHHKRNFRDTPEPKGAEKKQPAGKPVFVIQKHDASHLHYDFRLEMEGVLKSWAVPKGVPLTKAEKRLAMEVEDHPLDYGSFEGTIPEGNNGAGTVMLWDNGTFEAVDGDALEGLKKGKLHIVLLGKKLRGEWTLVRMRGRESGSKQPWLLIKSGEDMAPIPAKKVDRSVSTDRTMEEIATGRSRTWASNRPAAKEKLTRARPAKTRKTNQAIVDLPARPAEYISPMKALLVEKAPAGSEWLFEIKWDGYRAIAVKTGGSLHLFSRRPREITADFPSIATALANIPAESFVIDGEIVALDEKGRPAFQLLQNHNGAAGNLYYYVFDLMNLNDRDLTRVRLEERKIWLKDLLRGVDDPVRFSAAFAGQSEALLAQAKKSQIEGIIGKRADSTYEPERRSGSWIKIKIVNEQEFVIGGYTEPKGARELFGAILVGYHENGELRFASKVGTGFDSKTLHVLYARFKKLRTNECPFADIRLRRAGDKGLAPAELRRCTWIQPALVCQIKFAEWTQDGGLRQPVYLSLRDDKKPKEVVRERPAS